MILLASDARPQFVVDQVKSSGVKLLNLSDKQSLEGIRHDVLQITQAIGAESEANNLLAEMANDEQKLVALRSQHSSDKKALVLLDAATQGIFGLGKKSAGEHFLQLLQLGNSFDAEGNKPLSEEVLAANTAEVILVASRGDAKNAKTIERLAESSPQYAQLANTQAGKKGCVFAINIMDALGFEPYIAHYAHQILTTIQPCLK